MPLAGTHSPYLILSPSHCRAPPHTRRHHGRRRRREILPHVRRQRHGRRNGSTLPIFLARMWRTDSFTDPASSAGHFLTRGRRPTARAFSRMSWIPPSASVGADHGPALTNITRSPSVGAAVQPVDRNSDFTSLRRRIRRGRRAPTCLTATCTNRGSTLRRFSPTPTSQVDSMRSPEADIGAVRRG